MDVLFAALLAHSLVKKLEVHIISDICKMSRLARAKYASRAAYLKVTHGYAESAAELRELPYSVEPLLRDLGQHLPTLEREVSIRALVGSSDAPAELMKLRKSHIISVLNYESVNVRNVHARFNNGGAHKHVEDSVKELPPYL